MKNHILLVLTLVLTSVVAFAQDKDIARGTVTDQAGEPVVGVAVVNTSGSGWSTTGPDGGFVIESASAGDVLEFNCIGYAVVKVPFEGKEMNVVLKAESLELEEAVAIGYGSARKKDLTGAVGVLNSASLEQQSVAQLSQSLQGSVPGLIVTRSSSMPGASASIRIRGVTTMSENDPLILVDGMAVNSIDQVAPDDVEQITVLKDAASASIYGARAAAGVILITTKSAKEGDMNISYNGEFSIIQPTEWQEYLTDPITYMTMFNEYKWNDAGNPVGGEYQQYPETYIKNYMQNHAIDPITYPCYDWKSRMLNKTAMHHKHTVSMSYGNKVVKSRVSIGYENSDAIYEGASFERVSARMKNSFNVAKWLSGDLDFAIMHTLKSDPSYTPIRAANMYPQIYLGEYPDGRIAEGKRGSNAFANLFYGGSVANRKDYITGKAALHFKPLDGLTITASLSPTFQYTKKKTISKAVPIYDAYEVNQLIDYVAGHEMNDLTEVRDDYNTLETQVVATYENRFANAHSLNVMVGYEDYSYHFENHSAGATNLTLSEFPYLNFATYDEENGKVITVTGNATENAYRSFFGRVMYNYKGRYYAQFNARGDASSRFHRNYRWGFFPSASVGWVISEEKFMQKAPVISYLKLRGSFGTLGNERIGNYPYQSTIEFHDAIMFNSAGSSSVAQLSGAQTGYAVPDITWETTYTYDIGLDANFFDNRLTFSADYYHKETKDMLLEINIPSYVGYDNPSQNGGTMYTNGWELKIGWNDTVGDFRYGVGFNLSDYTSVMGDLKGTVFLGDQIIREGEEYNAWYGYRSSGIFQNRDQLLDAPTQLITSIAPGDIGYKDIGGPEGAPDNVVDPTYDKTILGSSLPHYVFGGNINLGWKNWSLGILFNGVGKQLNRLEAYMIQPFSGQWLSPPAVLKDNYWSPYNSEEKNLRAQYPRLSETSAESNNYVMSDYWLMDGSYFRIKNINLSYSLPKSVLDKAKIKGLRIYANVDDPYCFNHYLKGWDPEQTTNSYIARTWTIGLDIKF